MPRIIKSSNSSSDVPAPDENRPSAHYLASDFESFNPAHYVQKLRAAQHQAGLDVRVAAPDSSKELRSWVKPSTWFIGAGAAFTDIMASVRLRSEFRPVMYAVGALIFFLASAFCLVFLMLTHVLPR